MRTYYHDGHYFSSQQELSLTNVAWMGIHSIRQGRLLDVRSVARRQK